ncbi:MAG TPA: class I SAM-dependent methyltransferase [Gemmataceae bacterium]|jgi:SAM-dependent methyltransferase
MNETNGAGVRRLKPRLWRDHAWYSLMRLRQSLEEVLRQNGLLKRGGRIVDVGCGDRPYAPLFQDAGMEYVACDLGGDADVRFIPGERIPLEDGCADGVVSFQVLEHVWDLDWYLGECRRLLRPGGWMLLSTHGTWLYHPHPTDFRRWTRDGLDRELTTRGFSVETMHSVVGPLAWTTQFRLFGLRHVLQKIPIAGPLMYAPVLALMNLRMWLEDAVTPASMRETNASIYVTFSRRS